MKIMYIFYNGQFFCEARSDGTVKHDTSQDKTYVSLCLQALVIEEVLMYAICTILVKSFARQKIIAASQIHLRNRHRSGARLAPWRGNWLLI